MNSILRITDPIPIDDIIESFGYIEYEPITGTNFNNSGGDIWIIHKIFLHTQTKLFTYRRTLNKG